MRALFTRSFAPAIIAAALISCTDLGPSPDSSGIPDPQARWNSYRIHTYTVRQQILCFCGDAANTYVLTVLNDALVGVVNVSDGSPVPQDRWSRFRTVEQLFGLIKSINPDSVAALRVTYDPRFGYPAEIYVDPYGYVADEEYTYATSDLVPDYYSKVNAR